MKYYVTADIHGYYSELKTTLVEKGFFEDNGPHKLIICGDLFDRGREALELQEFILELLSKDEIILIRGNHEDLAEDLLNQWYRGSYLQNHHHTNGTIDTVCQLTGATVLDLYSQTDAVGRAFMQTPYIQEIMPAMVDYFETNRYIFVHGWIPCMPSGTGQQREYASIEDWRNAEPVIWRKARWINGMEAAHAGITEPGKTIICGHWHCSFGHSRYENNGSEFTNDANFAPYYNNGIIALDACTAFSGKVNCITLEDLV